MKKNFIRKVLSIGIMAGFMFYTTETNAQVTIGSGLKPADGAILDLKENSDGSSKKGMIMPRVNLESPTSLQPIVSSNVADYEIQKKLHEGMTVYNLNKTDQLTAGEYYWNGSRWLKKVVVESLGEESQVLMSDGKGNAIWSKVEIPTYEHYKITDMAFFNKDSATDRTYSYNDIVDYIYDDGYGKISYPRSGVFNNPIYATKFTIHSAKSEKYAFIIIDAVANFKTNNNLVVARGYWTTSVLEIYVNGILQGQHRQTTSIPVGGSPRINTSKSTILNLNNLKPGEYILEFKWKIDTSTMHANSDPDYPFIMNSGYFSPEESAFCTVSFTDIAFQLFEM